jgi:hypothetical protein
LSVIVQSNGGGKSVSIYSTGLGDDEPLVVSPGRAQRLLDIGHSRLYELIAARELESFKDGKSRKILMRSIKKYIERQLGAARMMTPAVPGARASPAARCGSG